MSMIELRGTFTALVTPFKNGQVDMDGFARLLATQKEAGLTGVVPCGCTGEAAVLSREERRALVQTTLEMVGDDMIVIAGTGTNSTESTIELTQEAEALGAHAAMLISPYYNKPTQGGLLHHYMTIAEKTSIPLVIYNVPSRTGVTIAVDTTARLYETGRFAAIKEAGGSVDVVSHLRHSSPITVLSGDDSLTLPMLSVGADGVISVVSNLYPAAVHRMVSSALDGDFSAARTIHYKLLPLFRDAFVETNPSPVKAMLAYRGIMTDEVRAPLVALSDENRNIVQQTVDEFAASWGGD